MAAAMLTYSFLMFVILFGSSFWVHGSVLKVCYGKLSFSQCSNCCSLKQGCMYLDPVTGQPTCIGGAPRACTRECQGPKLQVCPDSQPSPGKVVVTVVTGILPPLETGCEYHNLSSDANKCEQDSLVEVCNGDVSKYNCGCCGGQIGCLFLENSFEKHTCLPKKMGICPRICLPTVAVCSKSEGGTTIQSCSNKTCQEMKEGCSLYSLITGLDVCVSKKYGDA